MSLQKLHELAIKRVQLLEDMDRKEEAKLLLLSFLELRNLHENWKKAGDKLIEIAEKEPNGFWSVDKKGKPFWNG